MEGRVRLLELPVHPLLKLRQALPNPFRRLLAVCWIPSRPAARCGARGALRVVCGVHDGTCAELRCEPCFAEPLRKALHRMEDLAHHLAHALDTLDHWREVQHINCTLGGRHWRRRWGRWGRRRRRWLAKLVLDQAFDAVHAVGESIDFRVDPAPRS